MISHANIFTLIVIITFSSAAKTKHFRPLLTKYYLKGHELISCKNNTAEPDEMTKMLICLQQEFKLKVSSCNINETMMINRDDYECSSMKIKFDQEPYLKLEDIKELEKYPKVEMKLKNMVNVINIYDSIKNGSLGSLDKQKIYHYITLLPNSTLKLYPLELKDVCYDQQKALNFISLCSATIIENIMLPSIIASISCTILIIIIYLTSKKLRAMYFFICHSLSFILYQLFVSYNFILIPNLIFVNSIKVYLYVAEDAALMSSNCWINALSFQIWSASIR